MMIWISSTNASEKVSLRSPVELTITVRQLLPVRPRSTGATSTRDNLSISSASALDHFGAESFSSGSRM